MKKQRQYKNRGNSNRDPEEIGCRRNQKKTEWGTNIDDEKGKKR